MISGRCGRPWLSHTNNSINLTMFQFTEITKTSTDKKVDDEISNYEYIMFSYWNKPHTICNITLAKFHILIAGLVIICSQPVDCNQCTMRKL